MLDKIVMHASATESACGILEMGSETLCRVLLYWLWINYFKRNKDIDKGTS